MPQPQTLRTLTSSCRCAGRWLANDQETESPKKVIRGRAPGLRFGRFRYAGIADPYA